MNVEQIRLLETVQIVGEEKLPAYLRPVFQQLLKDTNVFMTDRVEQEFRRFLYKQEALERQKKQYD